MLMPHLEITSGHSSPESARRPTTLFSDRHPKRSQTTKVCCPKPTIHSSPGPHQVRKLAKRDSGEHSTEHGRRSALMKPTRARDKEHLRSIALQACTVCGRQPCEAHHIRYAQPRALGRKVSDEFTVPLCRLHHRQLHQQGDERVWWNKFKIDPVPIALKLWLRTRRGITPETDEGRQSTRGNDDWSNAKADGARPSDGSPSTDAEIAIEETQ